MNDSKDNNNLVFKLIIASIVGSMLAKVLSIRILADALGMSIGGFIFSCIAIALLVAILMKIKKNSVVVTGTQLEPKSKQEPIAEQDAPSNH